MLPCQIANKASLFENALTFRCSDGVCKLKKHTLSKMGF